MSLLSAKPASRRLPPWLRKSLNPKHTVHAVKCSLRTSGLHTVCEEARCPNLGECFSRGTATFLILGNKCTRHCGFCNVGHGVPQVLDPMEPLKVAEQVRDRGLKHAVVTSVTRDDLSDGGAKVFAEVIAAIREMAPTATIEVLTPDFEGRKLDIATVCSASPDVFNHNVETIARLTPQVRDRASYDRSLSVLATARRLLPQGRIKSGLMVGLGETDAEVGQTLRDLANVGCDIVTIGQYLQPNASALPVERYVHPETFQAFEAIGLRVGIKSLFCGPLVRSSYLADKVLVEEKERAR